MSDFHLAFGLGFESAGVHATGAYARDATFKQTSLANDLSPETKEIFKTLLANFAKEHLGAVLVDRYNPKDAALALTHYKPRPDEAIDWTKPLYDSDGFEHALIAMSSLEVVTKSQIAYVQWDRKTGECKRDGCTDMKIGNAPMSDEVRAARRAEAEKVMNDLRQHAADVDRLMSVFESRLRPPEVLASGERLRAELNMPQGMTQPVYLQLQAILEDQELAAAKGEDVAPGFEALGAAVNRLMDMSPWTLHPDHGCILRSTLTAIESHEQSRERQRG
jgi:hypothetical protein